MKNLNPAGGQCSGGSPHVSFYVTVDQFLWILTILFGWDASTRGQQVWMPSEEKKLLSWRNLHQDLSTRQHLAQKGTEESTKQGQRIWDVSSVIPKTENLSTPQNTLHVQVLEISQPLSFHPWSQANTYFWAELHSDGFFVTRRWDDDQGFNGFMPPTVW